MKHGDGETVGQTSGESVFNLFRNLYTKLFSVVSIINNFI